MGAFLSGVIVGVLLTLFIQFVFVPWGLEDEEE